MVRRKNTAECREVLRKVFENESTSGGEDAAGGQPGSGDRRPVATNRIAGSRAARSEPLLGEPQVVDAGSIDRHDTIRSSAPGAGLGDRGESLPGSTDRSGGDSGGDSGGERFASNVSDYVEEPVAASVEPPEVDAACSDEGVEDATGEFTGRGAASAGEDLLLEQEQEVGGGHAELEDAAAPSPGDGFSPEESPDSVPAGTLSRLRGWILGDDSRGLFARPVEVRASTLVIVGLSAAIVVGLLGLYFKIEPQEGRLAGRIIDDRAAAHAGAGGSPVARGAAATPGANTAVRTSANIPGKGFSALARPVWTRKGGQRPPVRNVAPVAQARPVVGFVTTAATRWLRVRDLMGKEECAKLLDHLKKLQKELKERGGCKDGSVACKELKNNMKKRHGEDLYAVDIGPFANWSLAQQASAELKKMTNRVPWVFRGKPDYFAESYPRKP